MRTTKQCHSCKKQFKYSDLIDYASPGAKTMYSYCKDCLKEKQDRDAFSMKVCQIFGIKSPGPQIWTERKRLRDTYGYTDQTIIDCLDYIYGVEKKKKLTESLVLVKPSTIERMMKYKKQKSAGIVQSLKTEMIEHIVPIKENTTSKKNEWNPDDWLDD